MLQEALVDKYVVTSFNNVIFDFFISYSKVSNVILKLKQDCCPKNSTQRGSHIPQARRSYTPISCLLVMTLRIDCYYY